MLRRFTTFVILLIANLSFAQEYSPYNSAIFNHYDRYAYSLRDSFHTSMKPYPVAKLQQIAPIDSLYHKTVATKAGDILWNRDLVRLRHDDLSLDVNPLFDFRLTRETEAGEKAFINTRGALVSAYIGDKIFLSTSFYENQASYISYQKHIVDSLGVVPGQGKHKAFKDTAFDFAYSQAYISYSPSDIFNFQLGYGKHFIGDGYRSLLLSDNSFSYPYFKWTVDVWKLKYSALWAQFQEPNISAPNVPNPRKWGAFHLLDWNVSKWLSLGMFEAVIWENESGGAHRGFDASYAIPLVFRRPVEFANGSPDNVLLGINTKISVTKSVILYGQLSLDEFMLEHVRARDGWWANKFGVQGGCKFFDIMQIPHLDVQLEHSMVRPFTYTHFTPMQNYGHYGQPLAHPLGANFSETVGIVKYNYKRLFLQSKTTYAISGLDSTSANYGGNIYKAYTTRTLELGNKIGQGVSRSLLTQDLSVSYLINPQVNMNITLGADIRHETIEKSVTRTAAFYFAFSTSLSTFYFDY